jgi:hypothetical protein
MSSTDPPQIEEEDAVAAVAIASGGPDYLTAVSLEDLHREIDFGYAHGILVIKDRPGTDQINVQGASAEKDTRIGQRGSCFHDHPVLEQLFSE